MTQMDASGGWGLGAGSGVDSFSATLKFPLRCMYLVNFTDIALVETLHLMKGSAISIRMLRENYRQDLDFVCVL